MKKIFIIICLLLFSQTAFASGKIMGIDETRWQTDLSKLTEYQFEENFIQEIKENAEIVKRKYQSENFQKISSKTSLKDKHKENPLFRTMHDKQISNSFLAKMNLSDNDYTQVMSYIPVLKKTYKDNEVAQMLPYITLAINLNLSPINIEYYVKKAVREETPIDIATMRLYRATLLEENS